MEADCSFDAMKIQHPESLGPELHLTANSSGHFVGKSGHHQTCLSIRRNIYPTNSSNNKDLVVVVGVERVDVSLWYYVKLYRPI